MRDTAWVARVVIPLAIWASVAAGCASEPKQTATRTADQERAKMASSEAQPAAAPAAQEPGETAGTAAGEESTPAPADVPQRSDTAATANMVASALQSIRTGQYESAIRECKSALRRDEKYTPAMELMARAYFHLGKTELAESICDIAIGIEPNSGRCYNLKGFIALKEDDQPRALAAFKKATEAAPSFGPGWLNLGAQYLGVKNYQAAVGAFERAERLLGERPDVYSNLGAAYRGIGELVKARGALKKAIELRSGYAPAYFNLGILYLDAADFPGTTKLQRLQIAIANLNKYKQLRGSHQRGDPVDTYLESAQREIQHEQKRIEREKRRKAREAAKKAKAAAAPRGGDQ